MGKIPIPDINTLIISATYAKTKSMAPLQDRKSRQLRRHSFVTMSPQTATCADATTRRRNSTRTPRRADTTPCGRRATRTQRHADDAPTPRRADTSRSRRSAENRPHCIRCATASAPSLISLRERAIRKQGQGDKAGRSMPLRTSGLGVIRPCGVRPCGVRPCGVRPGRRQAR